MKQPFSYHTFLFPFVWKTSGNTTIYQLIDRLPKEHWQEEVYDVQDGALQKNAEEYTLNYAMFQYFTQPARKLVFGQGEDGYMRLFSYCRGGKPWGSRADETQIGSYEITKGADVFKLVIHGIKLNIYDTGTAILSFELENWDHRDRDSVNAINEYGRRVWFPFLTPGRTGLTADKIEIKAEDAVIASEDFLQESIGLQNNTHGEEHSPISPTHIMAPIQNLLNCAVAENAPPDALRGNQDRFVIKPLVDDRMFVCCLVCDDKALEGLAQWDADAAEYVYLSNCEKDDHTLSDNLYKLVYIENSVSCASRRMKKELLRKSVYDRWIDYGTLYGITHHSFVCVTGADAAGESGLGDAVYNPFLTQYVEMAKIALNSRGMVLALSAEAANVAREVASNNSKGPQKIQELQERYVQAQSKMMLFEVTVQEQGVELFNMLSEQLYLPENKAALDDMIDDLRDVANTIYDRIEQQNDSALNTAMGLLTVFGLLFAWWQSLSPLLSEASPVYPYLACITNGLGFITLVFCLGAWIWLRKQKKK
ncbi:hypothetical protein LJC61_03365 [Ruminococcaceae bacterium OttesenSCG-928-A16]|nr:hypothetical protein [Ruminococcaceae bacterium OttesenSCG-928-A16]